MMRKLLGAGVLLATTLVPGMAQADTSAGTAACAVWYGAVTKDSRHLSQVVGAASTGKPELASGVFNGGVTLSGRWTEVPGPGDVDRHGETVINGSLYSTSYNATYGGELSPGSVRHTRIGGGWANFRFLDNASYWDGKSSWSRSARYAIHNDGRLYRWNTIKSTTTVASTPGFASIKSMTLISSTPTYDTFLANLKGGALYTIRIPSTTQLKPVVTAVRKSTWQGFERLVASPCGSSSTLLLAIDLDSKSGHLYAIGHAHGTATAIKSLGKASGTFADPVVFRWTPEDGHPNGD